MNLVYLIEVLYKGRALANLSLWKNVQAASTALALFLTAAMGWAKSSGVNVPVLGEGDVGALAAGIATAVSLYLTYATTPRIGLPAGSAGADGSGESK